MSASWGHGVRLLDREELAAYASSNRYWRQWAEERRLPVRDDGHLCSVGKCKETVTHRITYRYITGSAGREGTAERDYCRLHAQNFALNHGIEEQYLEPAAS